MLAVLNRCLWDDAASYSRGDSTLIAWATNSGRELWRAPDIGTGSTLTEPPGGTVAPWVDATRLRYAIPVSSRSKRELRGLSPKDGRELWRIPTGGLEASAGDDTHILLTPPLYESPPPASAPPEHVSLVDARSGKRLWTMTLASGTTTTGAAVMSGGVALLLTTTPATFTAPTTRLAVLDRTTGQVRWERAVDTYADPDAPPDSAPIAWNANLLHANGLLFLTFSATTIRIDPANGDELWRIADRMPPTGAATSAGAATLFAGPLTTADALAPPTVGEVGIDGASGRVVWTAPVGRRILAPGSTLVAEIPNGLSHQRATGYIVDASTGTVRWTTELGDDDSLLTRPGALYRGTGCPPTLRD